MPSCDKLVKCVPVSLLALQDKQFVIYLGPAFLHNPIIKVGQVAEKVPSFYETDPNLCPGATVYNRFFGSVLI